MDPETWRNRIASSLEDLGDEDFQRRSWLRGEGNEVSSFEEAVCALRDFDLSGFAERCVDWGFPMDLPERLLRYWDDLKKYAAEMGSTPSHDYILADPRWDLLRVRARELAQVVGRE